MSRVLGIAAAALILLATMPAADAVVFGGASSAGGAGASTTKGVNAPTGVAAGHFLLAQVVVEGGSGTSITPPAGWALVKRTDLGSDLGVAVYSRWASAAEPASYTWTFGASKKSSIGVSFYADVDPSTPIETAIATSTTDAATIAAPSVTTTSANALLVALVASKGDTTIAPPATMTERYDRNGAVTAESADQTMPTAGATGTRAFTAAKKEKMIAHTFALRKAPEKLVALNRTASSALESAGIVRYGVQLNVASSLQVKVDYAVGGTATGGGVDHGLAAGTLTFSPGQTFKWINASIVSDSLVEPDETLVISLSNPRNATLGANASATHVILNDDTSVAFLAATHATTEAAGALALQVGLAAASARPVRVDYAVSGGTAAAGADHQLASGTLTFAAGATTATIQASIVQDDLREMDETFVVQLASPVNATLGATSAATVTIADDDPQGALAIAGASMSEAVTAPALTVTLSRATFEMVAVQADVLPGSAGATDAVLASGLVQFPPGTTSRALVLAITNDALDEADETLVVRLRAPTNATLATAEATYLILDDDLPPAVGFASGASAVAERGPAALQVQLSAPSGLPVSVAYAAAASEDHALADGTLHFAPGETARTIDVPLVDDAVAEGDETLAIALASPSNATLGLATHVLTLLDDEAPVSVRFSSSALSVAETAGTVEARVVLSGAADVDVVVEVVTEGADATDAQVVAGNLTIPAGATSVAVPIQVLDDEAPEGPEALTLRLVNATVPIADATLAVTIVDDDPAYPTLQFEQAGSDGSESAGAALVAVGLSAPYPRAVTVAIDVVGGTAVGGGTDYAFAPQTLTFGPGETRVLVRLDLVDDALVEDPETLLLQLRDPTRASIGAIATHTLRIASDDLPPVQVRMATSSLLVSETSGGSDIHVELSRTSTAPVSVRYEAVPTGARGGGVDYALEPGILVFSPGEVAKSLRLEVVDDGDIEADETLAVGLSQPVGAVLGSPHALVATIVSDDAADITMQFASASSSVGEGGAVALVAVTLSAPSGEDISAAFAVTGGTASAADHGLVAGRILIPAGAAGATLSVPITQDGAYEGDETLVLGLADVDGAVLGAQTTHTLALLDDDPAPQRELVVAPMPVTLAGAPDVVAWGGWSAEPGQTLIASTNYLKVTNAGGVPNPSVVVSFAATGFVGATDPGHVVPIANNLQIAWWEDTTPGTSSPAEGTFSFAPAGAGAATLAFSGSGNIVYVAYRIVAMPDVLAPQAYQASFTVTEI